MDEQFFKLLNDAGEEVVCRVIFTFDAEEHSYVLYTIEGEDDGEISALRCELNDAGEVSDFAPLETEAEWEMVQEVLNTLVDEFSEDQANYMTLTNEDGEDIYCRILHRFDVEGKAYLFYAIDEEGEEPSEVFASAYIAGENGEVTELLPIESEAEWAMIEKVLASLAEVAE
ncbi:DUF1292 domain-containing protein [Metasolibacillus sp. FSL K6-0083]|uniref:DUF1292 domain-containing protein n=1 Tax=Metasolibacillus sp. FSL K6-0083 TaxID=2921416 RepID=UPI00315AC77E